MRKRELEMRLQQIRPIESPKAELEQYSTPATLAADALFLALARGDIMDRSVMDLGCGSGVLGIGAALLGAKVRAADVSEECILQTRRNAAEAGVTIDVELSEVGSVTGKVDTVVMNPPFGCQGRRADRAFLDKAMEMSTRIYSFHMSGTTDFIDRYTTERGYSVFGEKTYKFEIPNMFEFHRERRKEFDVSLLLISSE